MVRLAHIVILPSIIYISYFQCLAVDVIASQKGEAGGLYFPATVPIASIVRSPSIGDPVTEKVLLEVDNSLFS